VDCSEIPRQYGGSRLVCGFNRRFYLEIVGLLDDCRIEISGQYRGSRFVCLLRLCVCVCVCMCVCVCVCVFI
jgi:hypothetical protein